MRQAFVFGPGDRSNNVPVGQIAITFHFAANERGLLATRSPRTDRSSFHRRRGRASTTLLPGADDLWNASRGVLKKKEASTLAVNVEILCKFS